MFNTNFITIYEELLSLYEAKSKAKNNKTSISQTGPTFSEHIEQVCTSLAKIIPGTPTEQSGFLLYVSPKFIDDYSTLKAAYSESDITRLQNDIAKVISLLKKDGRFAHNDLGTEKLHSAGMCLGCKWGRLAGMPIRSHVMFAHDNVNNKKYFILASLFLHRKERWTNDEVTAGNSEYSKIYSYFKNTAKKTG